jgi:hypothetical protein
MVVINPALGIFVLVAGQLLLPVDGICTMEVGRRKLES